MSHTFEFLGDDGFGVGLDRCLHCLEEDLREVAPDSLYHTLVEAGGTFPAVKDHVPRDSADNGLVLWSQRRDWVLLG